MTRQTYVFDKEKRKLVPKEEARQSAGFFVQGDIEPYQSMITGEMIQGRRQHREHLKQHGCIEVGNEKLTPTRPKETTMHEYKRYVADILASKGY